MRYVQQLLDRGATYNKAVDLVADSVRELEEGGFFGENIIVDMEFINNSWEGYNPEKIVSLFKITLDNGEFREFAYDILEGWIPIVCQKV